MSLTNNFPNTRPELLLDFANVGRLDPRITFTRASTATYFNQVGVLTTAENNEARFDYDPATLAAKGLLIEEQRTNLCLQSQAFQTTWTTVQSSVSTNTTIAPDGTLTGDTVIPNTTFASHSVLQAGIGALDRATQRVISVFVKLAGYQGIRIQDNAFSNNFTRGFFNLSTLTASTAQNGSGVASGATITNVGNGWYRCSYTSTPNTTSGGGSDLTIAVIDTGTNVDFTGDGTSGVVLWGCQVEVGAFPTSYIPTTTIALTRNADVASMTGTNFSSWYNQATGTFLAETRQFGTNLGFAFIASDGTANNRLAQFRNGTTLSSRITVSGAATNPGDLSITAQSLIKSVMASTIGSANSAVNGTLSSSTSPASMPVVDQLRFGTDQAGGNVLNGWISKIAYYDTRLTNAQLQALTL